MRHIEATAKNLTVKEAINFTKKTNVNFLAQSSKKTKESTLRLFFTNGYNTYKFVKNQFVFVSSRNYDNK